MNKVYTVGEGEHMMYLSEPMYRNIFNNTPPLISRGLMYKWGSAYKRVVDAGLGIDIDHTTLRELTRSRREAYILEEIEFMDNLTGTNENVAHDATKQTVNAIRSHLYAINKLMEKL